MIALLERKRLPDGIGVFPDVLAPGAISAILQKSEAKSFSMPALAFHKNLGVPLFCPFKASWIVYDPKLVAETMFSLIRRQIAGESACSLKLDFTCESFD
jgi:hypothetical protein